MTQLALVHDWLNQMGGAEEVLEALVEMYPGAPVYTSMYWREGMPAAYRDWDVRVTWMDRLPSVYRHHQPYLPLYPLAFAGLDLSGYDLVLSNKSGFSFCVHTGPAPHVCYCLAPTRYVWEFDAYAAREALPGLARLALRPLVALLRRRDYAAAQRVDAFVAISTEIRERIRCYYGRDAAIIYPPVDVDKYAPASGHDSYYLIVSRLIPYKRVDLAVRAFNDLGLPLLIAGDGRDREALQALAGPNVTFLGYVPEPDLPGLLARCKAFIFPGREDFGIAPLKAQAAGRPVIALAAGGALDTIVPGRTGAFFDEPTPQSLAEVVRHFDAGAVSPAACRANAERFSKQHFRREIGAFVERVCESANQRAECR